MSLRKFAYFANHAMKAMVPDCLYRNQSKTIFNDITVEQHEEIEKRVNYYCKLNSNFSIPTDSQIIRKFNYKFKDSFYFFDLKSKLAYFNPDFRFKHIFGDSTALFEYPTLIKARPISDNNENSVLFKLDALRHFHFVSDNTKYSDKKNKLIWRGAAYQPHRIKFVKQFINHPLCDVKQTNVSEEIPDSKIAFTPIHEQLNYKFILSIEGNDVATNLKWIMSSNSLCFMCRPTKETWFMEGKLKAGYHYVELAPDYSDVEKKINYYIEHPSEAEAIIRNAQEYVKPFKDYKQEKLIQLSVLKKYFLLSNQDIT